MKSFSVLIRSAVQCPAVIVIFVLCFQSVFSDAFGAGGLPMRVPLKGTVAAKGTVPGEHGKPIWVRYDENGNVSLIGEAVGELANAAVMSSAEYNFRAEADNLTPVDSDKIKSVLLKENGQIITSEHEIGYHYAFFLPPGDIDVSGTAGRDSLSGYPGPGQDYRLLRPIKGATLTLGVLSKASSDKDGYYTLWYYTPFCVGTAVNVRNILTLKVYTGFSGQMLTRPGSYSLSYPVIHFCSGYSALLSSMTIAGAVTKLGMHGDEIGMEAYRHENRNIHVDTALLTGKAVIYNEKRPGIGMDPAITDRIIPVAPETEYTYDKPDFTPDRFPPDIDINADGISDTVKTESGKASVQFGDSDSASADLTRLADYRNNPDISDRGLPKQISGEDLNNTDIYI